MAYCFDEVVNIYGRFVEAELEGLEKGKAESVKAFQLRKKQLFLKLTDQQAQQKFRNPMATR